MRYSTVALAVAGIATVSAFEYPDFVPLHRRQEPGTPLYDCHANCGGVITQSRTENFCSSATFLSYYDACMVCALTYDIWQYYGNSVTTAGTTCGLDTTPEPAVPVETETTSSEPTTPTASDIVSVSLISDTPVTTPTDSPVATSNTDAPVTSSASETTTPGAAVSPSATTLASGVPTSSEGSTLVSSTWGAASTTEAATTIAPTLAIYTGAATFNSVDNIFMWSFGAVVAALL
ncbi:hypothetical protein A1O1_00002 [Capronia coronata CBS 617.96]|uniref:Uncharacterized protein n=1 Tax=Capronia coronata CBS 617.96 TaxID=1182541 RepID=W9ZK71_9EURO|nr:uncharacterized protein A1O1_00002 [Capronia coronata CBS 617.96]EXJ94884.1 hypothetical protein A1O1_00002 [Capronia coronata CBS 617.96]